MKTSLDHLPERKRVELARIVSLILERVQPEMIILFGSHARGDWVEELADDGFHYKYQSDYDILVVVDKPYLAEKTSPWDKIWSDAWHAVRTPLTLIVHDIGYVNRRLGKGQYFFSDIRKEGIVLYDAGHVQLEEPRELSPKERRNQAEEDYQYWVNSADSFFKQYNYALADEELNIAAFLLHQTAERLYAAMLLVFSRYKPSTHDIQQLGKRMAAIDPRVLQVFPQGTEEERHRFTLLRKAYVHARYKPSYTITPEELNWLADRVKHLRQLTEELCREKIESFV